ncbi:heat shock 70 kDa protein 12B-like [Ptychodera flava]|uniref:heat shock 70 kDa protein 12B-like n=1 Tax=Ptychodera flava TaxID=63121 RepID=UPI00396A110A
MSTISVEMRDVYEEAKVVVAIDFGTTYSGYAFSLTHHKDGKVHTSSCGIMEINTDMMLEEKTGKQMLAIDVFSRSLQFLKEQAVKELILAGTAKSENDLKYVLTVPAIWKPSSKQFMREAATRSSHKVTSVDENSVDQRPLTSQPTDAQEKENSVNSAADVHANEDRRTTQQVLTFIERVAAKGATSSKGVAHSSLRGTTQQVLNNHLESSSKRVTHSSEDAPPKASAFVTSPK